MERLAWVAEDHNRLVYHLPKPMPDGRSELYAYNFDQSIRVGSLILRRGAERVTRTGRAFIVSNVRDNLLIVTSRPHFTQNDGTWGLGAQNLSTWIGFGWAQTLADR
jgi:hypothetical protein